MTISSEIYPMLSEAPKKKKNRHATTCVYVGHALTLFIVLIVGVLIIYNNFFEESTPASLSPEPNLTAEALADAKLAKRYSTELANLYNRVNAEMTMAHRLMNIKLDDIKNLVVINKLQYNEISKMMKARLEENVVPALDVLQRQVERLTNTSETMSNLLLFDFTLKNSTDNNTIMYDDDHV